MSQPRSGNDALMSGGGVPWAKFPTKGSVVTGKVIAEPIVQQRREFETNDPMVWPNGDPQEEIVVKLSTEERDPETEDDDGVRALHIYNQMKAVIRDAVRNAGAKGISVGGTLTVKYVRDGIPKGKGKPPKEYTATYAPPSAGGNTALMGGAESNGDRPAGVDAETWARMAPEQRDVMRALAANRAAV